MRLSSSTAVAVVIFVVTVSAPPPVYPARRYVINDVISDVIAGPESAAVGDVTRGGADRLLQMVFKSQLCDRRLPPWRPLDDESAAAAAARLKVGSTRSRPPPPIHRRYGLNSTGAVSS